MHLKAEENRTFIQKRRSATCPGLYKTSDFMFPKISTCSRHKSCPFIPRRATLACKDLLHSISIPSKGTCHHVRNTSFPKSNFFLFSLQKLGKHLSYETALKPSELHKKRSFQKIYRIRRKRILFQSFSLTAFLSWPSASALSACQLTSSIC